MLDISLSVYANMVFIIRKMIATMCSFKIYVQFHLIPFPIYAHSLSASFVCVLCSLFFVDIPVTFWWGLNLKNVKQCTCTFVLTMFCILGIGSLLSGSRINHIAMK